MTKSVLYGILASTILLGVYFAVLTLVSDWDFAKGQFSDFWYFIVSLAIGFGIQIGLYTYLRNLIRGMHGEGKVLSVTGTTSTAAMVSCCAHYLANLLPILGTVGIVTFVAQYQVELFWVGLLFNLGGIIYITNKVIKFSTEGRHIRLWWKTNVKYIRFILIAAVVIFLAYFLFVVNRDTRKDKTQSSDRQQQVDQNGLETKIDEQGQVTVKITPQALDGAEWKFDVVFNTHSIELNQDIMQIAELTDDQGIIYKPIAWEGAEPGGHHREGMLVFEAVNPAPSSIELKIKKVGGIAERSFKWYLQ